MKYAGYKLFGYPVFINENLETPEVRLEPLTKEKAEEVARHIAADRLAEKLVNESTKEGVL